MIGDRIRELRVLSGMSQEELGHRVGLQRAAINKYELGGVTNIPIATIEKLALALDVSPTYLVNWDDSNSQPLALEVKVLNGVQKFYGKEAVSLLESFSKLSPASKKKVQSYAEDLTFLPKR